MTEEPSGGNLAGEGFVCHTCGQYHPELPMSFGMDAPALYDAIPQAEYAEKAASGKFYVLHLGI